MGKLDEVKDELGMLDELENGCVVKLDDELDNSDGLKDELGELEELKDEW